MGSQHKDTRQLQQEQLAALIEQRTALLTSLGKSADAVAKDAPLKKLRGDLRRTRAAIASIEKRAKTVADARMQKDANAEKRAATRPKKKKNKGQEAAPVADKKKKKEKKQQ